MWNLPDRSYHNWEHAQYMLALALQHKEQIEQSVNWHALILAILFHDIIYVPGSKENEKLSADFFQASLKSTVYYEYDVNIHQAINKTKYLSYFGAPVDFTKDPLGWWLQMLDLYPLLVNDRETCLMNFIRVWGEYERLCDYDKITYEEKQNLYLQALATEFRFEYKDITWKEIEAELLKPIELEK